MNTNTANFGNKEVVIVGIVIIVRKIKKERIKDFFRVSIKPKA